MAEASVIRRIDNATSLRADDLRDPEYAAADPVAVSPLDEGAPLRARLAFLRVGEMWAGVVEAGMAAAVVLTASETVRILLPLDGQATARLTNGSAHALDRAGGLVTGPGEGVTVTTLGPFTLVTLTFPVPTVQTQMATVIGEAVGPVRFAARLDLVAAPGREWCAGAARVRAMAHDAGAGRSLPPPALDLRLASLLVRTQPSQVSPRLLHPMPGVVERAIDVIEANPAHRWSIGELAAAVPCGVRTLQAAFQRALGTTPTEYVRRVRLERVREELERALPGGATVTDIAMGWGFAHMGRFSAAYFAAFDEYPRQTLRSSWHDR
ncbi:MAG TPA: AraC family transcriptional regulator [Mycobacteriales bacterium]|nr:AraC family transcriptional regulator [Mycobacteriales bacterium]